MRIFLDTNVILDIALQRPLFRAASEKVLEVCNESGNTGIIASHTLATGYYLLAKGIDHDTAKAFFLDLLNQVDVDPASTHLARKAFSSGMKDTEDALQIVVAESVAADVIVTRNTKDFVGSAILVKTPDEFVDSP